MIGHPFLVPDQEFDLYVDLLALTDSLHGAIDHLAPEKTFQSKKSKPSWVDAEIKLLTSEQVLFSENSTKMASAFKHNEICDAFEDNKNFWK